MHTGGHAAKIGQPTNRARRLRRGVFGSALLVLGYIELNWLFALNALSGRAGFWLFLYAIKTAIEIVATAYAGFYLLVALCYRVPDTPEGCAASARPRETWVAYLCCDDFDPEALENLAQFCARTGSSLFVHDDSSSESARQSVDRAVDRLCASVSAAIMVLRRPNRDGGKPAAVNHVLQALSRTAEFLLLCDSDSYLMVGASALGRALEMFADPAVAVVQFHNRGYVSPGDSLGYRTLSRSVGFYDAFVGFMDRFGWSPFLGHNAILRVSALRHVGGFTPGQLADDIDLSVRLRMAGYKIRYAPFAAAAERHPETYAALRRRTAKWAYGCTQILLRWGASVLFSRRFTFAEKATFFLTVSYYHFQALLLLYLGIFYIALPFDNTFSGAPGPLLVSAGLILFLTFFPSLTWFSRNADLRFWPGATIRWGLTYGSQDVVVVGAITRCLCGLRLPWVPTNAPFGNGTRPLYAAEVSLGLLIVSVAALRLPVLLLLPTTALFAGKFLIVPWLNSWIFRPAAASPDISQNEVMKCAPTVLS